ncbi:hypothetical protein [Geodermatophilus marinus]|uniref:hypothetical protein n=1 Tax=Geodermatophilus sp. LHW52908 TaxID=2303986 RepID=UPI0011C1BDB1|nr:hypothetical protein [Geodermatophilus sp. LHW52908]
MSGAKTLEEVVELLYGRCGEDPSIADREGCEAAVQERLATAPVTWIDAGAPGCAARWESGGIILSGADCATAFHLVDAKGQPLDPAIVPADGRLPQGGGIAPGAVSPPGESAVDEAFLDDVSGAQTLEQAAEILYRRCGDDPSVTDRTGCEAAVQERLATAPVTWIGAGAPGCAARWESGGIILSGADCATAFHLVDAKGQPLDPAIVPADGRLPQGGGIAPGAVPAPGVSEGGAGGTTGGGPPVPQTVSPAPGVDDFFQKFGGTPTLKEAIKALTDRCLAERGVLEEGEVEVIDKQACVEKVPAFFETAPVVVADPDAEGCQASWVEAAGDQPGHVLLIGGGCVAAFGLVDADGDPIELEDLPEDGRLRPGSGISQAAAQEAEAAASGSSTAPPETTPAETTSEPPPAETTSQPPPPPPGTTSQAPPPPPPPGTTGQAPPPPAETTSEPPPPPAETTSEPPPPPAETTSEPPLPPAETTSEPPPAGTTSEPPPPGTTSQAPPPPAETTSQAPPPPAETTAGPNEDATGSTTP